MGLRIGSLLVVVIVCLAVRTSAQIVDLSSEVVDGPASDAEAAKAAMADVLECKGPHEKISVMMLRRPYAKVLVDAGKTVDVCLTHPRNAVILGLECQRGEEIFDEYPDWRCPLDADCFGGGHFRNARRASLRDSNDDRTCIEFKNKSGRFRQTASVVFSIYIP